MVTDEELEKIRKMSKEEKIEYLENRIEKVLSELPEEDKQAMMSAAPQMMDNLFGGQLMGLISMVKNMFSLLSEEDVKKLKNLLGQSKKGVEPESMDQFMSEGTDLFEKLMEKMMGNEGLELINKTLGMFGDSENIQQINLSEETQEKLGEIRELVRVIVSEMSPEDYLELPQR
ncbi:MAG: hypothetical protein QW279_00990, partial [Candidatus Jordarchaeaceae archaeon]